MRKLVVVVMLIVAGIGLAHSNQQRHARPNIVFILVDDLRWDELGIAGHPFLKTPKIDRIGKEGALFRNAFLTTPLCSPSRASFLTFQSCYLKKYIEVLTALLQPAAELLVVHQFKVTPKALASFSPRLERSDNLGIRTSNSH